MDGGGLGMNENGDVATIGASTANNPRGVQRITISVDNSTGKLAVDLDARSLDEALSILRRAEVELEARVKFALGQQLALEAVQNARMNQIAQDAIRRGPRGA